MFPIKRKNSEAEQLSLLDVTDDEICLSEEQQFFVDTALLGKNILVDACIGSGKTTAIQCLCNEFPNTKRILYLTYNKLLKLDARKRIVKKNVDVTNYHGFAYSMLMKNGIQPGYEDSVSIFNEKKPFIPTYDVLIIDEYQDIESEFAEMLEYIKSQNNHIQIIAVGDMEQKIYDKTSLDVQQFIRKFLDEHEAISFTYCFRLSKEIAEMLGRVWEKPIIGVNDNCVVEKMTFDEVTEFLKYKEPKDILCLGQRTEGMAKLLNMLETSYPYQFNKKTVFASIRPSDGNKTEPNSKTAIFTSFDSSKGMERPICIVCDWTSSYWYHRLMAPDQKYTVLRNVFCVAASRGKDNIIFVEDDNFPLLTEEQLGDAIQGKAFRDPISINEMFDFKYKEDVDFAYGVMNIAQVIKTKQVSDGQGSIVIKDHDELIDLSPCINTFLKATYFKKYKIDNAIKQHLLTDKKYHFDSNVKELSLEEKILYLIALETRQERYRTQVKLPFVNEYAIPSLFGKLNEWFVEEDDIQIKSSIPFYNREGEIAFHAEGLSDVVKDDVYYSLNYVDELSHTHFLVCACYMIALSLEKGFVLNIKNNTIYSVTIPDKDSFLDAVAKAVTKGKLQKYYKGR